MADKKIITDELLKLQTEKILQVVADLTYDFVPFDDTEISNILEISDEQAMQLTKILNDQVVANNKLWSSSKTDAEIKNALIESNKYADELIGKISSISLEYVTTLPTSDIKSNVIYILQGTPNTLNVYNTSTSAFVTVGDLNLDLSGYYTKTEVDNLLADKADDNTVVHADAIVSDLTTTSGTTVLSSAGLQTELDKKFDKSGILSSVSATPSDEKVLSEKATKTELDKKIDKTSISTAFSDTPSDEKVPSEKAVKAELDKKIDKTSIATSISSSSTDTQVASAKAVYDKCIQGKFIDETVVETYGTEFLKYPLGKWCIPSQAIAKLFTDLPNNANSGHLEILVTSTTQTNPWEKPYASRIYNYQRFSGEKYTRYIKNNGTPGNITIDSGWQRVCVTKVNDVAKTAIAFTDSTNYSLNGGFYIVKNGMCSFRLSFKALVPLGTLTPIFTLPKPALGFYDAFLSSNTTSSAVAQFSITSAGGLCIRSGTANAVYLIEGTYAVLEE